MRLFVAVDLPEEVKRGLQLLCAGVSGAKWVEAEQIHLTLRFIGEVERTHLAEISDALGAVDAAALRVRSPASATSPTAAGPTRYGPASIPVPSC